MPSASIAAHCASEYGFVTYRLGYASAIAWVLFAVIMTLTALQLRLQRFWVHYGI